jgi:hypothetical protein
MLLTTTPSVQMHIPCDRRSSLSVVLPPF